MGTQEKQKMPLVERKPRPMEETPVTLNEYELRCLLGAIETQMSHPDPMKRWHPKALKEVIPGLTAKLKRAKEVVS